MSRALLIKDLKRSGLLERHIRTLKIELVSKQKLAVITDNAFKNVPAYKIPYFDINGKKLSFYRLRFLEPPKQTGFAKKRKVLRYWQPKDSKPYLYLCPIVKWREVANDITKDIYITEGEKKSAKACKEGLCCIGLGGVWSWRSKKQEEVIISEFNSISWQGRNIHLCFDSDAHTNPDVVRALNAFSHAMVGIGAKVFVIELLPDKNSDKVGLDDYLVKHGIKSFIELPKHPFSKSSELWKLNEEVAYIKKVSAVYMLGSHQINKSKNQLVDLIYANRNYTLYDQDLEKWVTYNAMKEWLKWPHRREHKDLTYAPGESEVTHDGCLNTWEGWGVEPVKGDVKPFNSLLEFVFKNASKEEKKWFLQWLAYPIQNPGTKLFSNVLIWGRSQGTGKSFIGYIVGDIYGKNFSAITEDQLHDDYNEWLIGKQFILGEEITGSDKRRDNDRIKNIVTQESVVVRAKYQPTIILPDVANHLSTSNHPDAYFVEGPDRRTFIHEVTGKPMEQNFYNKIDTWRKAGGASALMHHLLNVSLRGFNPKEAPPVTNSKIDMIMLSKSDVDIVVEQLLNDPDSVLQMGGVEVERDLFTIDEVMSFLYKDERHPSRIAVSKAMRRVGLIQRSVYVSGAAKKLWAVRNVKRWDVAKPGMWASNYLSDRTPAAAKAGNVVQIPSKQRKRG